MEISQKQYDDLRTFKHKQPGTQEMQLFAEMPDGSWSNLVTAMNYTADEFEIYKRAAFNDNVIFNLQPYLC